ncbi:MAG: hypothetical protein JXN61_06590 [Sedimentisphaerales bacterium]|nr:hypothetical protein [Sedimentisphaerales bacterium]
MKLHRKFRVRQINNDAEHEIEAGRIGTELVDTAAGESWTELTLPSFMGSGHIYLVCLDDQYREASNRAITRLRLQSGYHSFVLSASLTLSNEPISTHMEIINTLHYENIRLGCALEAGKQYTLDYRFRDSEGKVCPIHEHTDAQRKSKLPWWNGLDSLLPELQVVPLHRNYLCDVWVIRVVDVTVVCHISESTPANCFEDCAKLIVDKAMLQMGHTVRKTPIAFFHPHNTQHTERTENWRYAFGQELLKRLKRRWQPDTIKEYSCREIIKVIGWEIGLFVFEQYWLERLKKLAYIWIGSIKCIDGPVASSMKAPI